MLPLHGDSIPSNSQEMVISLRRGLGRVVHFPATGDDVVRLDGDFPEIRRLEIDLSETTLRRPPDGEPIGVGRTQPGPTIQRLIFGARPLHCEGVPVHLELTADDVRFQFDVDARGQWVLVPVEAKGRFEGQVPQSGLESLLLTVVREAAEKQSVTIRSTQLTLHQHSGPRTLKAIVRVEATKRIGFLPLSGAFRIAGRLDVGDDLVAHVSQLNCEGEGKLAGLIAPLISARLHQFNDLKLELAAIPLGDIRLQDLHVGVTNDSLLLQAKFGT